MTLRPLVVAAIAMALLVAFASPGYAEFQVKVVAIDVSPKRCAGIDTPEGKASLRHLVSNLTKAGYKVRLIEEISAKTLRDVDVLILGRAAGPGSLRPEEVRAIAQWFRQGGKLLWLGADGDARRAGEEDATYRADEPNKVLEAIGSHIRVDYCTVEDFGSYVENADYVLVTRVESGLNEEGEAAEITKGVDRLLFRSPACLIGCMDGRLVAPEEAIEAGAMWLCRTGDHGTVVDMDGVKPVVYEVGYKGRLYLAMAEEIPVVSDLFTIVYSKVVVTGEAVVGGESIAIDSYGGVSLDGMRFAMNVVKWGLKVKAEPNMTGYVIISVIVIIVMAGMATYALRRGRRYAEETLGRR